MHRTGPPNANVREHPVRVDHPLDGDGIRSFLIALRVPAVEVGGDTDLGRDDGDMSGVHGSDDIGDPGWCLEAGFCLGSVVVVGPLEEPWHE